MKYKVKGHYLTLTIDEQFNDYTIQQLFEYFHLSKKTIHLLKQNKDYQLNSVFTHANTVLKKGDQLTIKAFIHCDQPFISEYYPLDIVYEDEFLLIINKAPGMNVHPDHIEGTGTLCNYVQCYYDMNGIDYPVRYIHRLDYDTSGLIVFCKCQFLQAYLDYKLSIKAISRHYLAIVNKGMNDTKWHTINNYLAKDRHHSNKMRVAKNGQQAITHYRLYQKGNHYNVVECKLDTGRTHQIRVHLSSIGYPIIGDSVYGKPSQKIKRQALHAYRLKFTHPITQNPIDLVCNLPDDMSSLI